MTSVALAQDIHRARLFRPSSILLDLHSEVMSHRQRYGRFAHPPSESSVADESVASEKQSRRPANVYDAVAGGLPLT